MSKKQTRKSLDALEKHTWSEIQALFREHLTMIKVAKVLALPYYVLTKWIAKDPKKSAWFWKLKTETSRERKNERERKYAAKFRHNPEILKRIRRANMEINRLARLEKARIARDKRDNKNIDKDTENRTISIDISTTDVL